MNISAATRRKVFAVLGAEEVVYYEAIREAGFLKRFLLPVTWLFVLLAGLSHVPDCIGQRPVLFSKSPGVMNGMTHSPCCP
jgi:hypothetical protein